MSNPMPPPPNAHPKADARTAPIFGTLAPLIRMDALTPEQAPWVTHPIFAWEAIERHAQAALRHMPVRDLVRADPEAVMRCMEDVLGTRWRRECIEEGFIEHNLLAELQRHVMTGHWVMLEQVSAAFTLVDWADDAAQPEGGRWRVNRNGRLSGIGEALQWQLDCQYRQRRLRSRRMNAAVLAPDVLARKEIAREKKGGAEPPNALEDDLELICPNMSNAEFFSLMMRLRDKAVSLMGDRLAELARWSSADRAKVALWLGEDSETIRQTLRDGLIRMREIMQGLTEKNFTRFTPEGMRAVGCEPKSKEGDIPATASVCGVDGTYTIFIGTKFCTTAAEQNHIDTGIPFDADSKLTVLIHEVSHFQKTMGTDDPFYGIWGSTTAARRRDALTIKNADSIAYYVTNIPNWKYDPPQWKP